MRNGILLLATLAMSIPVLGVSVQITVSSPPVCVYPSGVLYANASGGVRSEGSRVAIRSSWHAHAKIGRSAHAPSLK